MVSARYLKVSFCVLGLWDPQNRDQKTNPRMQKRRGHGMRGPRRLAALHQHSVSAQDLPGRSGFRKRRDTPR